MRNNHIALENSERLMRLGAFELHLLRDGLFSLPPRSAVGSHLEGGQPLLVGMNCLLVRGHGQTVLIDAGVGSKPRLDFVETYRMEWPRRLYAELDKLQVARDDVDVVILTHLHWDHVGGATLAGDSDVVPAFPRARYFVQESEWERAMNTPPGDRYYLREDFVPLADANVLTMVDGDSEILPGIEVRLTGAHSAGHQIVLVGSDSERAVFLADLIPTASLLSPEASMIYDVDKAALAREKQKILREAAEGHWLLIFQHAPRLQAGYLISAEGSPQIEWVPM